MTMSIRNPRVAIMAKQLATLRGVNMTEAIAQALEAELKREREARPLAERLLEFGDLVAAKAGPLGRPMSQGEIDEMWTG